VRALDEGAAINAFPLVVLVDDSEFTARNLNNFLWVTFTRSNPAVDIDGIGAEVVHKHWGCRGSLVIDARRKPQHAPPLDRGPGGVAPRRRARGRGRAAARAGG
jgi:4-hydroxy-3-polyprenylbenzoate decarboxylase